MSRHLSRKRLVSALCFGLASAALGGCAIHPLPENVTGVRTAEIVHRNRCEAREAIKHIEWWLAQHNPKAIKTLQQLGVALSYTLDITESDGLTATTAFEQILSKGTFTFGPTAGDMLKRENKRAFTIADNYLTLKQMQTCDTGLPTGSNYQYPIVGTIGIAETIQTFLTMALHEDLNTPVTNNTDEDKYYKSLAGSPTLVETLTFTTTINAGVTPTVSLNAVGKATQLTSGSLAFTWNRIDMHAVIIALGLPNVPPPDVEASLGRTTNYVRYSTLPAAAGGASRSRTPLLIDASVPAGTTARSGIVPALEALNNHIIRFEVGRSNVFLAQ
jgi:hypothetical protein